MKQRIDTETTSSTHKGFKGFLEILLRRFKTGMHAGLMIPVYMVTLAALGVCLTPGVALFRTISALTSSSPTWVQNLSYGVCFATGYFLYGVSLIFFAPLLNFAIRGQLKPWRGPYYSAEAIKWVLHNLLTYIVRYTFLELVTPSPLSVLFYKMMGMKVGRGAAINTTAISDPSLIELGEKATIGGSVTIIAHYGQAGYLVIAPVKIGARCTVGLRAIIMGGAQIGDDVKILPNSVVLPKTVIPDGETWGGVPAVKIDLKSDSNRAA